MYRVTAKCLFVLIFVRLRGGCSLPFKLQKGILKYDHHHHPWIRVYTRVDRLLSITCTSVRTNNSKEKNDSKIGVWKCRTGIEKSKLHSYFFNVEWKKLLSPCLKFLFYSKSEFIKKGTRFSLFFLIKIFENSSRKVFSKLSKRNKLCLNRRYWIFRFSYLLRIFFLFF